MSADRALPVREGAVATTRFLDYVTLTKPRLNSLTIFAVAAGWWAAAQGVASPARFAGTLVGAAFVAGGASALNQVMERDRDAQMERTADRPLPAGRMDPWQAIAFGVAISAAGLALLAVAANALTMALGAICLAWYVGIYTPLKKRTSLNTLAGTVPGALPPVMGVAAATGTIAPEAAFLFALVTAWQLPHFLSIAWLYRAQYARAGYAMLPCVAGGETSTARQVVLQALLTITVSLAAVPLGLAGRGYFYAALAAGVVLMGASAAFALERSDRSARTLLRVSILHLPVVLVAFAMDRV